MIENVFIKLPGVKLLFPGILIAGLIALAAMKLASAITLGSWTLAQSTSTGLRLAPDALPIWAKEPRSDVAFHNAQISTVHEVLLYPILDGVARAL